MESSLKRKKKTKSIRGLTKLSSPFSTGGGGVIFENRVQALFVVLMVAKGFIPCLPRAIKKIKLQGKYAGYETDDLIVFTGEADGNKGAKLLCQVKRTLSLTAKDKEFAAVLHAAWTDFKNPGLFTEGQDAIALITTPMGGKDFQDAMTTLERARHAEDSIDFINQINRGIFSANQKKKLEVIRIHLKVANGSMDISDDDLWRFLKSLHILAYDLDIDSGTTLSFLFSIMGRSTKVTAPNLWKQILNEVQSANLNAGTISIESLPDEIRSAFQKDLVETIPVEFAPVPPNPGRTNWGRFSLSRDLAVAGLLGAWNENFSGDRKAVEILSKEDFGTWIVKIREILNQPSSPVALKNGHWNISKRLEMWQELGHQVFDEHLDRFGELAVTVLKEKDPQFELDPEDRLAASLTGKVLTHSHLLRKGLAETLILLGCKSEPLKNCSQGKAQSVPAIVVRELFSNADWILWASLNNLLPLIAESAPAQFLEAVETLLQKNPVPFKELFAQEGKGTFGSNYMTGLLWALETLAWDEILLPRVTVILGELAAIDPGGNWANRPGNSLTTIFLPWMPQTTASVEKRRIAIQTLQKEIPPIGWNVLINLLPNNHQVSMGTHKPVWRNLIPPDWPKQVSGKEYREQVSNYADMAVAASFIDMSKLMDLVDHFENLPKPAFEKLLDHLGTEEIISRPEEERLPLWNKMVEIVAKHKKFSDANWALPAEVLDKVEGICTKLSPRSPIHLHRRLFTGADFDLYEERGDWKAEKTKLDEKRQAAIKEILDSNGLDAVLEFAKTVDRYSEIGIALGFVADDSVEKSILPLFLDDQNNVFSQMVAGFVWGRFRKSEWKWVDLIDFTNWTKVQIGRLLSILPFNSETWGRVEKLFGSSDSEYWSKANVNPYWDGADLDLAVDKLVEHGRPNAAISCLDIILRDKNKKMDNTRAIKTLLAAVSTKEKPNSMDVYHTLGIIKALQNDPTVDTDGLFRVEWAYLAILNRFQNAYPKYLWKKLATEPEFFCEIIRLVYRSTNDPKSSEEPSKDRIAIATNAHRLLDEWQTIPGTQADGSISVDVFNAWLNSVKKECQETGHLEIALLSIGKTLIYTAPDVTGLWIDRAVAEALNARDADSMRRGYNSGTYNSRGVHSVDPTGKPERELAEKFRSRAEDVDKLGCQRFAASLRELAETYDREAERVILEHKRDDIA